MREEQEVGWKQRREVWWVGAKDTLRKQQELHLAYSEKRKERHQPFPFSHTMQADAIHSEKQSIRQMRTRTAANQRQEQHRNKSNAYQIKPCAPGTGVPKQPRVIPNLVNVHQTYNTTLT